MHKNSSFSESLKHAVRGYADALKRERNLRSHTVISNLICFFAYHYKLSKTQWAILILTISAVICCELLNSAIEKAVDTATSKIRADAMHSKDFAAAATLVCAIAAILVGICLFGNIKNICSALISIFTSFKSIIVLVILCIADIRILFINKKINLRRNYGK